MLGGRVYDIYHKSGTTPGEVPQSRQRQPEICRKHERQQQEGQDNIFKV